MKHADALRIAEGLVGQFRPVCERIEIKGSVCRMKPEPKDIELLAVPDLSPVPTPRLEFGQRIPPKYKTHLDAMIAEMIESGVCYLKASGDKYKKMWLIDECIQVDLFIVTPPAQWGVQSVIRTGPSDFSHWMVTRQKLGGALPDDLIVQDGSVGHRVRGDKGDGKADTISTPEEIDFFTLCGMDWIEPSERVAKWRRVGAH